MPYLGIALDKISKHLGLEVATVIDILWTILIVVAYLAIKRLMKTLIDRRAQDPASAYRATKTSNYIMGIICGLAILNIWFGGVKDVMTYVAIVSAGLAIALQGPLTNLAGWLIIVIRKPFVVGDRIEIGETAGDVIDIRMFQFSIVEIGNWVEADQSTGRIIHIPNAWVFDKSLANYTLGFNFIWNEVPVMVTFESDWKKAKEILQCIADEVNPFDSDQAQEEIKQVSGQFLVHYRHLTPIVWTRVDDSGVTLTIRYLCEPRKRRSSETRIWEMVLAKFALADDIDFAYPSQRFYFNPTEGKPGTGGPEKQS